MNRRTFITTGAVTAAGLQILPFPLFGKNSPAEKLIVGVMGTQSRGSYLAGLLARTEGVEVAYICDVEDGAIANGVNAVKKYQSREPKVIKDVRRLVEEKDLDALFIAAPDHWHAPAAILAASAGKHVYVEKPCGHNPAEGEMLVEAARKYNKMIQMGNQRRSWPQIVEAVKAVKEGIIGKPYFGKAWYYNDRKPIGTGKKIAVPSNLDWELWQGPAIRKEFQDNIVHYNWHWFWNWGTAETCNNGTHEIDCLRWAMGVDYPSKVTSSGGRYAFSGDDWQTPDTQVASFEFGDDVSITWEGRSCHPFGPENSGRGWMLYGSQGVWVNKGGASSEFLDLKGKLIREIKYQDAAPSQATNTVSSGGERLDLEHLLNFTEGVRGNAQLNSPILEGHKTVLLCHLANIAQRTGTTLHCDPSNGHILKNKEAQKFWGREYAKGWEPKI